MAEIKTDNRSFNKRLMDAMAEMENPTKAKKGYNYMYETLEQVLGIIRPALSKHGLMLFQSVKWHPTYNGFVLETGVFGDNESRIMDERPFHQANDAQAEGSWETYMRRYALRTAFGLTGEDDDGAATLKSNKVKFTEVASDAQMNKLNNAIAEYAALCEQDSDKIVDALLKTKALHGANFESLTLAQAETALTQINVWISKTEKVEDKDIPF